MNYTIIGHTEDSSYHDRCGDYVSEPGKFETEFFRDDGKAEFLKAWAHAKFHSTYEDLLILINGIPDNEMNEAEYAAFEIVEAEMKEQEKIVEAEHEVAEAIRKEAAANAAVAKARLIAKQQHDRDLAQLAELQRRLGL